MSRKFTEFLLMANRVMVAILVIVILIGLAISMLSGCAPAHDYTLRALDSASCTVEELDDLVDEMTGPQQGIHWCHLSDDHRIEQNRTAFVSMEGYRNFQAWLVQRRWRHSSQGGPIERIYRGIPRNTDPIVKWAEAWEECDGHDRRVGFWLEFDCQADREKPWITGTLEDDLDENVAWRIEWQAYADSQVEAY